MAKQAAAVAQQQESEAGSAVVAGEAPLVGSGARIHVFDGLRPRSIRAAALRARHMVRGADPPV